jgi:hypothetical protein
MLEEAGRLPPPLHTLEAVMRTANHSGALTDPDVCRLMDQMLAGGADPDSLLECAMIAGTDAVVDHLLAARATLPRRAIEWLLKRERLRRRYRRVDETTRQRFVARLVDVARRGAEVESSYVRPCYPLREAILMGDVDVVRTLIELGADPAVAVGARDEFALALAIDQGDPAMVRTILEALARHVN